MKKWTVTDRYGHSIYLTEERWHHILESRCELESYFELFLETLRKGNRKQDSLMMNKYRYYQYFEELLPSNNHIVVVVVFNMQVDEKGSYLPNNFVVTGWAKYIFPKGGTNESLQN